MKKTAFNDSNHIIIEMSFNYFLTQYHPIQDLRAIQGRELQLKW